MAGLDFSLLQAKETCFRGELSCCWLPSLRVWLSAATSTSLHHYSLSEKCWWLVLQQKSEALFSQVVLCS